MLMNVDSAMTNDAANAMVAEPQQTVDELDVVIIGAGISGIGAASYIRRELPGKTVCVLEGQARIGACRPFEFYPPQSGAGDRRGRGGIPQAHRER